MFTVSKYFAVCVQVLLVNFTLRTASKTLDLFESKITHSENVDNERSSAIDLFNHQKPISSVVKPAIFTAGCTCQTEPSEMISCRCVGESISEIPSDFPSEVSKISLESTGIEVLKSNSLQPYNSSLSDLYMVEMPHLVAIENGTFLNIQSLSILYIKRAPKLKVLPNELFDGNWPDFKILRIVHSGLEIIPNMNKLVTKTIFSIIDFDSNRIRNITSGSIDVKAESMSLSHNLIEFVQDLSLLGSEIASLSLKGNEKLRTIEPDAFTGLKNLRRLDLSHTSINTLPTRGLEELEVLRITDTFTLKKFPLVLQFPKIREAHLAYSYHCCAFKFPNTQDPVEYARMKSWNDVQSKRCSSSPSQTTTSDPLDTIIVSTIPPKRLPKALSGFHFPENTDEEAVYGQIMYSPSPINDTNGLGFDWSNHGGFFQEGFEKSVDSQHYKDYFDELGGGTFHLTTVSHPDQETPIQAFCGDFTRHYQNVTCHPEPDAFNPCEDVMGHWSLRVCVWIVAIAALLGNLAVVGVLLVSARMTVSKFLMCHLAVADFCMGLYLLMIASVDLHTKGSYFNYAIQWQHGPGCQIAGFLTVFASELSIFTLTVITLERWYAITYAIHLNRRLQLGTAAKVMALGWVYAIAMASLPLFGVSGYARTSICLPMDKDSMGDLAYLTCLLILNGIAFALVCACYIKMYVTIKVSRATRRHHKSDCSDSIGANRASHSDMSVAKRMAMLVFTDFACWAPISFFGLTAVAGYPLIDLTKSKILLVFFYPLNSCANPFLYAILTKQYRRDVCLICSKYFQKKGKSPDYPAKATGRTLSSNTQQMHKTTVSAICRGSLLTRLHGHRTNSHSKNVQKSHSAILKQFKDKPNSARVSLTGTTAAQVHRKPFMTDILPKTKPGEHREIKPPVEENLKFFENNRPITENKEDCSSDEDEEGRYSPAVRRGSPHPIKNNYTKLACPSPEQEIILRRALSVGVPETSGNAENADSVVLWSTPTKSSTTTDATGSGVDNSTSTRDTSV